MTPTSLLHDFGGRGPAVHLAHANGFPPGAYRLLAQTLTDGYHVIALPARPLWPGSLPSSAPTWHPLADDLIAGLDSLDLRGIVGIGHSLGGVLTLWAAIRRPDLFRAVVLIDPVILPPTWLWALRLLRALRLHQRQPLVQGALHRRRAWPSHRACYDHYRSKAVFANWPDAVLWDYVHFGTTERGDGQVELAYPPAWEAHIFATAPTDVWRQMHRLRIPALVVRGERSRTFLAQAQARMARCLSEAQFAVMPGASHLLPMEQPWHIGALIRRFLEGIGIPEHV